MNTAVYTAFLYIYLSTLFARRNIAMGALLQCNRWNGTIVGIDIFAYSYIVQWPEHHAIHMHMLRYSAYHLAK